MGGGLPATGTGRPVSAVTAFVSQGWGPGVAALAASPRAPSDPGKPESPEKCASEALNPTSGRHFLELTVSADTLN